MKKKMLAFALAMAMALGLLSGCGSNSSSSSESSSDTQSETSTEADYSDKKIALLLSGSANDGGWSQMAADAASSVQDTYNCTVNYSESLPATDYESVMRGYADQGYDIIIAHGAEFLDTTMAVAADYPDIHFINTSANEESMASAPSNVTGIDFGTFQLGFLCGAAAGFVTESNKIGAIGSNEVSSIVAWVDGVQAGANYVNPDAQVISAFTGSYDDQVKAKQCTDSLVEQGCDVITQNADACGKGAVAECDALGVKNVGSVADETTEGDSCFLSIIQDSQLGIEIAVSQVLTGELGGGFYDFGPVDQVTRLSDYAGTYADALTDEQKAIMADLVDQLHDGVDLKSLDPIG